jgi:hypothetical protein
VCCVELEGTREGGEGERNNDERNREIERLGRVYVMYPSASTKEYR